MRQLRRKWLMVLPILAISTMAFGQVLHTPGGAGAYGTPYGWLGNAGANAWEQYRQGTGHGTVLVPDVPTAGVNEPGNNTRVRYKYNTSDCPYNDSIAGPLGTQYYTTQANMGLLLNRTASGNATDPANLFYFKWSSDMFWQRWTAGQCTLRVGFMEDASGFVTAAGGDTGSTSVWNQNGSDMVYFDWQFKAVSDNVDDEYYLAVQKAVALSGLSATGRNGAGITDLRPTHTGGNPSATVKKYYTGTDANMWGGEGTVYGLGVTTVDYVLNPTATDDANQCDPCWPGPPSIGGPNYLYNDDANNPPALEISTKMYTSTGSVANGGSDKFAPNTGDGNDWSSGDVILQVKTAAVVWSVPIDVTTIPNTDGNAWEGGSFDWQNATPFIQMEHGSWNKIPTEIVVGIVHPGDTNTDGTIDYSGDISFAVINYGTVDTALHHGDVSQDGQVDYTGDISLMVNAYGTYATDLPPPSGELELVIDYVTGEVSIVANSATNVAGFEFKSPDGSIITGSLGTTGQFSMNLATSLAATEFNLSGGSALDGTYSLGNIFAGNQNWTFGYNFVGGTLTQTTDDVTYVPEPATLSLVVLGGLGLLLRRRRR